MSKPNPRRAAKSSSRKQARETENDESTDRTASRSAANPSASRATVENDPKDDTNGDKKDGKTPDDTTATTPSAPKPQSAGATIRDAGQRLLSLTMKQEWTSIDPVLKQLEKIVAAAGAEANLAPLAGIMDPVSILNDRRPFQRKHSHFNCINMFVIIGLK